MTPVNLARASAILFILWGLMHIVGGGAILAALAESAEAGFATYRNSAGTYPPLAGAILGFFAFLIAGLGVVVTVVGATLGWRNRAPGLVLNVALAGMADLGLAIFLVAPGFISVPEAAAGIALLALATISGAWARGWTA